MKEYKPKDRIPFTKTFPPCPKCGGETRRFYKRGYEDDWHTPYSRWDWPEDIEFLDVICQECRFRFPQHIKPKGYKK